MLRLTLMLMLFITTPSYAQPAGLFSFAVLKTSEGDIRLKLYNREAPLSVDNFIGLASGKKQFRDIKTGKKVKNTVFYKDMIFHKVHPDLVIQTGCPWGNGKGWPGYTVKQEQNSLKFDRPYLVAMAKIEGNENSAGSQFFITTKALPYLDKDYTVMGEVETGHNVVDLISHAPRDAMMRPLEPIQLIEVVIER